MYKLLKDLPKIDVQVSQDSTLPFMRVGICLWEPDESLKKLLPTPPTECPICGESEFKETERLSALLNPKLGFEDNNLSYVMGVWVHPKCFEDCFETDEPEPIPW